MGVALLHVPLLLAAHLSLCLGIFGLQLVLVVIIGFTGLFEPVRAAVPAVCALVVLARVTGLLLPAHAQVARQNRSPRIDHQILRKAAWLLALGAALTMLWKPIPLATSFSWALAYATLASAMPRAPRPHRSWSHYAFMAGITVFWVVVGAAVLEGAARMHFGRPVPFAESMHTERTYTPRPNGHGVYERKLSNRPVEHVPYSYGSQGFRGELTQTSPPGTVRILCIGDSMTFGSGVGEEQAMPHQLAEVLNEASPSTRYEIVNAGVGGYGPAQQLSYLREIIDRVEPDFVLHQYLAANDIYDDLLLEGKFPDSFQFKDASAKCWIRHNDHLLLRLHRWLMNESSAYHAVIPEQHAAYGAIHLLDSMRLLGRSAMPKVPTPVDRPSWFEFSLKEWYPAMTYGWEVNKKNILAMRDECAARGITLISFVVPTGLEMNDMAWESFLNSIEHTDASGDLYDRRKSIELPNQFFAESGILYVEIGPAYERLEDLTNLTYQEDGHWTPYGCTFVAHALAAGLAEILPENFPKVVSPPPPPPAEASESVASLRE
jgi:hypothetical protein